MVQELVEVDTFVVILVAHNVCKLSETSNHKQVYLRLEPKVWVLQLQGHYVSSSPALHLVDLGETGCSKCFLLDPDEVIGHGTFVIALVSDSDVVKRYLRGLVLQ